MRVHGNGWKNGWQTVTVIIEPISCKKEPLVFERLRAMKIMRTETI